jgi:hypothetical protein
MFVIQQDHSSKDGGVCIGSRGDNRQFDPTKSLKAGADGCRQVPASRWLSAESEANDATGLIFHRPAVDSRLRPQARLQALF